MCVCLLPRRDVSVARHFILLHHSARDTFEPFSGLNISSTLNEAFVLLCAERERRHCVADD